MAYIDGFILAVPNANRQKFIDQAKWVDALIIEFGTTRILESWSDDLPNGKHTDFRKAVKAKDDESVVFTWVEWPDKETRDAGYKRMRELAMTDERFDEEKNPVPYDSLRMIWGGFVPVLEF